jgi:putative ABC transport system permease protein
VWFSRADADLSREIDSHLQLLEDRFVSQGMSREAARDAAKRAFGGVEQAKERQRDARSFRWLAGWPMDLKLGVRMLAKSPGLTIVGVIALAIAIGAGAAFREFTSDLLNPTLDVPGAERIVGIRVWNAQRRADETHLLKDFDTWRRHAKHIEDLGAARSSERAIVTPDGRVDPIRTAQISASAFRLVPTPPLFGRTLTADDEQPSAPPVAVIGHDVWRDRFGGRQDVLGSVARLGATSYAIVGVMPPGFAFPVNQEFWIPLKNTDMVHQVFARLAARATADTAQAELTALSADLKLRPAVAIDVRPYLDSLIYDERQSFEVVMLRSLNLVFIVLLGVCGANVATLVFARTAMREAELTVRTALGASRGRISAQLFAEALVLSLVAAVAGLLAAQFVGQWAKGLYLQGIGRMPFWWDDGLSLLTIVYAFALAVFAASIVGVVPALKATGRNLQARMREGVSGTSTMKFGGVWSAVIVTQVALTVAFLSVVLSLGLTGLKKQQGSDVAYSREHLLTAIIEMAAGSEEPRHPDADAATYRAVRDRLLQEPGVAGVSYTSAMPGTIFERAFIELQSPDLQARAEAEARRVTDALWCERARIGEGFFETAGLPLVAGRVFSAAEIRQRAPVAVVDETFVREILGGRSPLGVTLRERTESADTDGPWIEIIGVVKDATVRERKRPLDAALYRPAVGGMRTRLLVGTREPAAAMSQRVHHAVLSVDPEIRLADLKSLAHVAYDDALPERIFLRAFTVIGAIALLLATAGIYALMSFTLARRTREIGICVALGAAPRRILGSVFAKAFRQIGLGVAAGALPAFVILASDDVGAIASARAIGATIAVCLFVIAVTLISCSAPLRRALRVDPIAALRAE